MKVYGYGAKYVFGRSGFGILVIVFMRSVLRRCRCYTDDMPNDGLDSRFEARGVGHHQSHLLATDQKGPVASVLQLQPCYLSLSHVSFYKTRGFLSIPRLWPRLHQDSNPPTKVSQDKGFAAPCFQVHAKQNSTTLYLLSSLLRVSCPTRGK